MINLTVISTQHGIPEGDAGLVASAGPPTGVGEPAAPGIPPAEANAVLAATGQRLDRRAPKLG